MSNQSIITQRLLSRLEGAYGNAELVMMDKVAKKVARGIQVDGWTAEKMSEVESIRKDMKRLLRDTNRVAKAEVQQSLIDTYMNGVNAQNKHYGLPKTIMEAENVPLSLQRLILESDGLIDGTSFQVLRNTDDAYRNIISQLSTGVLTGVETKQQVAQRALNAFAAKGITGFTDKAGRKWNLGSYIDMAVRTTTARAALQGHVDRATELGYDLIRVSNLYSTCPICAPWNGAILSVSGNTLKYKSLESAKAAGLFHPNCMHTLTAYSEEYDEIDRMLGQKTVENEQNDLELYEATQQQRSNERKIRQWRRMEAVALDPASKARAQAKIRQYQGVQRELISKYEQFGLKRQYARERLGKVTGVETVKEFEKLKLTKDAHTVVQPVAPSVTPTPAPIAPVPVKPVKQVAPHRPSTNVAAKPEAKPIVETKPNIVNVQSQAQKVPAKSSIEEMPIEAETMLRHVKKGSMYDGRKKLVLTDADLKPMQKSFDNMPPNLKKMVTALENSGKGLKGLLHDDGAYYMPNSNKIHMNMKADLTNKRGKFATFFHEYGHHIDEILESKYKLGSVSSTFQQAIYDDFDKYFKGMSDNERQTKASLLLGKFGNDKCSGFQDILGGVSGAKGKRIRMTWGHSEDYWNDGKLIAYEYRKHLVAQEAMAQIFMANAMGGTQLAAFKEVFPTALKEYDKMVNVVLEKLVK